MICYKGKVLTVDSNDTVAGYLVEDKGRIVYVGNELPEQYKNVQTVELGKRGAGSGIRRYTSAYGIIFYISRRT
ncbi:MAG: hypothetical protein ACLS9K_01025 [Lachnospira eligens]